MDLQTRKLNLITYLAQLQDEKFFEKIENYIFKQSSNSGVELERFSVEELKVRIEKSEEDYKNGKFLTHEDLEKNSEKW